MSQPPVPQTPVSQPPVPQPPENATELDVRTIPGPQRHPLIFSVLQQLAVGHSLIIKNDHNPIPLRQQVDGYFVGEFAWEYLEEGPEAFRLCFTRKAAAQIIENAPESTCTGNLPVINN